MADVYLRFAADFPDADRSDSAASDMFAAESLGVKVKDSPVVNAFMLGKSWMDITLAGWREDIAKGNLFVFELQEGCDHSDGYPDWFLRKVGIIHP